MNRLILPLSEEFIYASPEAVNRSSYRICRSLSPKPKRRIKGTQKPEVRHAKQRS